MPSYFTEGNTPRGTDGKIRSLHKLASLADDWAGTDGENSPRPNDSAERLLVKIVSSLFNKTYA